MFGNGYFTTPPVVKNLIIINVLFYMAETILPAGVSNGIISHLALFPWGSGQFEVYQMVTYMFLHDWNSISHIFFNMFALWMFGRQLEYDLGSKRFLTFYMVSGVGAALIQLLVNWGELQYLTAQFNANPMNGELYARISAIATTPSVGASGAIFGLLLGFGMLHPNSVIMLMFPPIPLKAKYFVLIYGLIELFLGISGRMTSVAHFAHVGGMLWGFLLLWWWRRKGTLYY